MTCLFSVEPEAKHLWINLVIQIIITKMSFIVIMHNTFKTTMHNRIYTSCSPQRLYKTK